MREQQGYCDMSSSHKLQVTFILKKSQLKIFKYCKHDSYFRLERMSVGLLVSVVHCKTRMPTINSVDIGSRLQNVGFHVIASHDTIVCEHV